MKRLTPIVAAAAIRALRPCPRPRPLPALIDSFLPPPTSPRAMTTRTASSITAPASARRESPPKKPRVEDGGGDSTSHPHPPPPLSASLSGPPTLSLVPPGRCQLNEEFTSVTLLERLSVSRTSSLLRFGLPDGTKPLNLSTCACVLARASLPKVGGGDDGPEVEDVVRPYTPISTNALVGCFDLLVKHYENGRMSRHLKTLPAGSTLDFKHIDFNVKIQAPFSQKRIGMLVGGTGVTPMIQALHAILGDDGDNSARVSMLYGSRTSDDILGREMLDSWSDMAGDRLSVTHVLSHEPEEGSDWTGERGYIDREMISRHMPGPGRGDDVLVFVCGPPPMYDALCGPRDKKEVGGLLAEMGYGAGQVYKF